MSFPILLVCGVPNGPWMEGTFSQVASGEKNIPVVVGSGDLVQSAEPPALSAASVAAAAAQKLNRSATEAIEAQRKRRTSPPRHISRLPHSSPPLLLSRPPRFSPPHHLSLPRRSSPPQPLSRPPQFSPPRVTPLLLPLVAPPALSAASAAAKAEQKRNGSNRSTAEASFLIIFC